jgi:3-methyladenine DNA glycosylase/8-oxoguanine DNA glycosylase
MAEAKDLKNYQAVVLRPKPPFVFDPSFHKPAHYPTSDTAWEPGIRWQTMLWGGRPLGLKFGNAGTVKKPKINLGVFSEKKLSPHFLNSLTAEINYRYDLDTDPSEFIDKFEKDKQLGPIIKKWLGMRPISPQSLYEYLVIGIMLQNCTVKRSVSMTQTLFERYGTLLKYDGRKFYCFWEPKVLDKISEEELRSLKVGYRAKALKRITTPFANNEIEELELRKKTKEEQGEVLLSLYGIGPATVGYILFDVFKHYDELSHISPWEQKIYSKIFFDRNPEKPVSMNRLLKLFRKRFGKYKMLAVHYLWEDLWWRRKDEPVPWLEKLIRL